MQDTQAEQAQFRSGASRMASLEFPAGAPGWLPRLLRISDFAHDVLRHDASVRAGLVSLVEDERPPRSRWQPGEGDFTTRLRTFRRAESLRLIARDLLGLDDVDATLRGSSDLAEVCIAQALAQAQAEVTGRHGVLRDEGGGVQHPVVFALGKLGGRELNFSSDVDLVFAYPHGGPDSDGARPLPPDAWHARVVQRCAQLLAQITADGFAYRVDLRLRPFGQSGKPSLPFSAMELYFQREGRDWERYAWLKARAVAGDVEAGTAFLESLRPFVYRRYLDYSAIDSLAEMKAQIDLEVLRQELIDDIKLGPGGIREIEFLVQAVQLVRGGREPALRCHGLLPALAACTQAGYVEPGTAAALAQAYRFLRRLENRMQMLRDEQVHALPHHGEDRARIAEGLGYADWATLRVDLDRHRTVVQGEFALVLAPRRARGDDTTADMLALWRGLADGVLDAERLRTAGIEIGDALRERLRNLAASPSLRALSARTRGRLDHLMAALLQRLHVHDEDDDVAASAVVDLLQVLLRRSNYLALLAQQPAALDRLFELARASRWLVRHLIEHPLLLDDVFDPRAPEPPDEAEIASVLADAGTDTDAETVLAALAEAKTSLYFRLGLACIAGSLPASVIAARLAAIAAVVLRRVLDLALADTVRRHGWPEGADANHSGLALIGYGSLGGAEMGFASDLDLVFVFDPRRGSGETTGPAPVEGQRFYARVVQKLIAYLAVSLPGGRLYEIDARLRPDGAKGLLVTSLDAYTDYQRQRAWTWEQQALVRARFVAGDPALGERFAASRQSSLGQARDRLALRHEVAQMRERLRRERDRGSQYRFDLKQGHGGLVDLEFLLQYQVLANAARFPALLGEPPGHDIGGNTGELLRRLAHAGLLDTETVVRLVEAREWLLQAALTRTLDDRPRVVPLTPRLATATRILGQAYEHTFGMNTAVES